MLLLSHATVVAGKVTFQDAALAYARAGLPVFPLQPGGKTPLVARGFYRATTDESTITQWWRRHPAANIGIPTGPASGWVVLDIDPRHDGLYSLAQLQRAVTHHATDTHQPPVHVLATRIQHTGGGGLHLVFGWRNDLAMPLRNTTCFAGYPGLDLRGQAGYIVVAPSRHQSGERYRWLHEGALMPFPDHLVDLLRASARAEAPPPLSWQPRVSGIPHVRRTDPAYWLELALVHAREGTRHTYALFLACHLLDDAALTPSQAEPWLRAYAQRVPCGQHPYEVEDALNCLAWAAWRRV